MNDTNSRARFLLVASAKITPVLIAARYTNGLPSGLLGNAAVAMSSVAFFFAVARSSGLSLSLFASSTHFETIEIVALCVISVVLLWKLTLLSGSFQLTDEGGVQLRVKMSV